MTQQVMMPDPVTNYRGLRYYTAEMMEAYAASKVWEALEAAVNAVHDTLYPKNTRSDWTQFAHDRAISSEQAVEAIRALIPK